MKPKLTKHTSLKTFQSYYWLKNELVIFCRNNGLSTTGTKQDLEERIIHYLSTGEKLKLKRIPSKKTSKRNKPIRLKDKIGQNYKNDAYHRAFFKSVIGERFKYNVQFIKWMKKNIEKQYQDAVKEWLKIEKEKKSGKKYKIAPQFEYNQYTRDFFKNNPTKSRQDAIKCWKYKKNLPGNNKYSFYDLKALR